MNEQNNILGEIEDPRLIRERGSLFEGLKDNVPKRFNGILGDLITDHRPLEEKDNGDAFSPALYRKGTTRGNKNVLTITALIFDLDDLQPEQWESFRSLAKLYVHVWWTTYSHLMKGKGERYRVLFPVSRPIKPHEFRTMWAAVNAELGGLADLSARDEARLSFLPATHPDRMDQARIEWNPGHRIDVD